MRALSCRSSSRWVKKMKKLCILLCVALCCGAAPEEAKSKRHTFQARLVKVQLLSGFQGKVIRVGIDPRFVVTLALHTPFHTYPKGQTIHFAIHSPTRSLVSAKQVQPSETVHEFEVTQTERGNWVHFTRRWKRPNKRVERDE